MVKTIQDLKDALHKTKPKVIKKLLLKEGIFVSFQGDIIRLCYKDGSSNWSELSRASRNTFWFNNGTEWEILRMGMERGAEIAGKGITNTQDIKDGSLDIFDENQKAIMTAFSSNNELPNETVLTAKSDGCCLFVCYYPYNDENAISAINKRIEEIEENKTKEFFNIIKEETKKIKENGIFVFGTNGSLFCNPDMVYTWTQALAGTANIELSNEISWQNTLKIALPIVLPKMLELVKAISAENYIRVNLAFEGILENRRDVWGNRVFTELVENYDWSGLVYLGSTISFGKTCGIYRPHFIDEELVNSLGFRQPLFWNIGNSSIKADNMIRDLDAILKEEITVNDFLNYHKPSNKYLSNDTVIDHEGFVLLDKVNDRWHYSKLKTYLYYKLHKLRFSNLPFLLTLPTSASNKIPNLIVANIINKALNEGVENFRNEILRLMDCWMPDDFEGNLKHSSIFSRELEKTKNENYRISLQSKMEGSIKAYKLAFEEKANNQLDLMLHNDDIAKRELEKAFSTILGFSPKDDKQFKNIIQLLNPRKEMNLDDVKRDLFYGFADAISRKST